MDQNEQLISDFARLNPTAYQLYAREVHWIIPQLLYHLDIQRLLAEDEIQQCLEKGKLGEAANYTLERLVSSYIGYGCRYKGEEYSGVLLRFEGFLTWFLEHERGMAAYGKVFGQRKAELQNIRHIFQLGEKLDEGDNTETDVDDNNYIVEHGVDGEQTPVALLVQKRVVRNVARERVFEELRCQPARLPNLGQIDRLQILDSILAKAQVCRHFHRFFHDLDTASIKNFLEEGINPKVRMICEEGLFNFENIQDLGQNADTLDSPGVYLHMLWTEESSIRQFWLYVGQSINMRARINDHHKRRRQGIHFGLHYYIWNQPQEKFSQFMTIFTPEMSYFDRQPQQYQQLFLNLAEMWMCCIFQTLSPHHLNEYLPSDIKGLWAGRQLNIALPLWQSFSDSLEDRVHSIGGRANFSALLKSSDPEVRKWAEQIRSGFNQLRNSPDPVLRRYYDLRIRDSTQAATAAHLEKSRDKMREYLSGMERPVERYESNSLEYVTCGMFTIIISRRLGLHLKKGDKVVVQFHLAETIHPMKYAIKSAAVDPASRLAISLSLSLSGEDANTKSHVWLLSTGQKAIYKMNTLVDILEGYSLVERENFSRRWRIRNKPREERSSRNEYS